MKNSRARVAFKNIAKIALRYVPRSNSRFTGRLAIHGGLPVRDVRVRPYNDGNLATRWAWIRTVAPAFKEIYLSGVEGLPQVRQTRFAATFAKYCEADYGLMLPHGTDALRFAVAAALEVDGLEYGGEILVPNLSFVASATCALDRRVGVAFVDVDPSTLNIDPRSAENAIVPGVTKAIMAVHQFGQPAEMDAINAVASRHGLKVIEDAAQAHGAVWNSRKVGSIGDVGCFSFQSFKNLNCGEGGMLTTNDPKIFEASYSLHNVGRKLDAPQRWEHASLGWNCRSTEYQAALLEIRLPLLSAQSSRREANAILLRKLIADCDCLQPVLSHDLVTTHSNYMLAVRYKSERCGGVTIDDFLKAVNAEGAPFHRGYSKTLSQQQVFRGIAKKHPRFVRVTHTPVADEAVKELLYIGSQVLLGTSADMEDIALAVQKVQKHFAGGNF